MEYLRWRISETAAVQPTAWDAGPISRRVRRDTMITDIDDQLADWVENVLGPVAFSLGPPEQAPADAGVSCYLMELLDNPPLRTSRRPPLQIFLRYLVTIWASAPKEAHQMLEDLLFATMEAPDLQVEVEPLTAAGWRALGVTPRPSFFLRVPLRRERPQPGVKLVRQPLGIEAVPVASLQGQVVGVGGVPLARAVVPTDTFSSRCCPLGCTCDSSASGPRDRRYATRLRTP
jgi:hypothetical protein